MFREAEIEASKKVPRADAIKHMKNFLEKYDIIFHPTNYIMLNVKLKLGCIYGNVPTESILSKMTPEEISQKLKWCQDGLRVLDILDPGTFSDSTWKSRLQREITKCRFKDKILVLLLLNFHGRINNTLLTYRNTSFLDLFWCHHSFWVHCLQDMTW